VNGGEPIGRAAGAIGIRAASFGLFSPSPGTSLLKREARMIRQFQERMPYGLFVPGIDTGLGHA
jgi:hypothetical protein